MKKTRILTGLVAVALVVGGVAASGPAQAAELGVEWTPAEVPNAGSPQQSVAFGDGAFVSVSNGGVLSRSTDGKTWTQVDIQGAGNGISDVTFGGGIFVAVGAQYHMSSSDGGLTWTGPLRFMNYLYYTVVYGNGVFVTVEGATCTNMSNTSPNGVTWTQHFAATNASPCWQDIAFSGTNFVAVSGEYVEYSPDGITWSSATLPSSFISSVCDLNSVASDGDGTLFAVGTEQSGGDTNSVLLKSTDNGANWTQISLSGLLLNTYRSVGFGNGTWLLGERWSDSTNTTGGMLRSTDGTAWGEVSAPDYEWTDFAYGNDTFVAVGDPDLSDASPIVWSTGTTDPDTGPTLPDTGTSDHALAISFGLVSLLAGAGAVLFTVMRRRRQNA